MCWLVGVGERCGGSRAHRAGLPPPAPPPSPSIDDITPFNRAAPRVLVATPTCAHSLSAQPACTERASCGACCAALAERRSAPCVRSASASSPSAGPAAAECSTLSAPPSPLPAAATSHARRATKRMHSMCAAWAATEEAPTLACSAPEPGADRWLREEAPGSCTPALAPSDRRLP